jgi:hypothetical protein
VFTDRQDKSKARFSTASKITVTGILRYSDKAAGACLDRDTIRLLGQVIIKHGTAHLKIDVYKLILNRDTYSDNVAYTENGEQTQFIQW